MDENRRRTRQGPEFELIDTGIFDESRYFDVIVEYAKAAPDDILIRSRSPIADRSLRTLHLLPTLWFRNTWAWGGNGEGYWDKPACISASTGPGSAGDHETLGKFRLHAGPTHGRVQCCYRK